RRRRSQPRPRGRRALREGGGQLLRRPRRALRGDGALDARRGPRLPRHRRLARISPRDADGPDGARELPLLLPPPPPPVPPRAPPGSAAAPPPPLTTRGASTSPFFPGR